MPRVTASHVPEHPAVEPRPDTAEMAFAQPLAPQWSRGADAAERLTAGKSRRRPPAIRNGTAACRLRRPTGGLLDHTERRIAAMEPQPSGCGEEQRLGLPVAEIGPAAME